MKLARSPVVFRRRLVILRVVVSISILLLAAGYYRIQILHHEHFQDMGARFRMRKQNIKASRGLIHDCEGRLITRNLPAYNLVLLRDEIQEPWENLAPRLAEFLTMDQKELDAQYEKARHQFLSTPVLLKRGLPFSDVVRVWRNRNRYQGLSVQTTSRRDYTYPTLFPHVLGYVGEASPESGDGVYGEIVGKRGIEKAYNHVLTGEDGERSVHINSRGLFYFEEVTRQPSPGGNLFLTLDMDLQRAAQQTLADQNGAIIVMDVNDGSILVFFSSPVFDLNMFTRRISQEEWNALLSEEGQPLFNRPLQGLYAPGSVFKLVTALACLKAKVISPDTSFTCHGEAIFNNHPFHCHRRDGHGELNLMEALEQSCNIYFYHAARELGVDALADTARALGFGQVTGIDLLGEKTGTVPSPRWKRDKYHQLWYPGETLSMSIGQGHLQVTPIQLAQLMAAIAGEGQWPQPHFLMRWEKQGESLVHQPHASSAPGFPAEHFKLIKQAMWGVVNHVQGTGNLAAVPGLDICGKTGTAQLVTFSPDVKEYDDEFKNAWFAGFAPKDHPQVAVVVLVERAGGGGLNAAPIAKEMFKAYFQQQRIMAGI